MKLMDRIVLMDPRSISPFHEEEFQKHTKKIASSMSKNGWIGRPLIVMELRDGTIKGITGSHRLRAALAAGLSEIPVIRLTDRERDAIVESNRVGNWFDKDRQNLYDGDAWAPTNQAMYEELHEVGSPALGDLLSIEDWNIKKVDAKLIDKLFYDGYPEEVIELL